MARAKNTKTAWQVRSGKLHELSVKVSAMPVAGATYERKAAVTRASTARGQAKKTTK